MRIKETSMNSQYDVSARKRPVNLTLNESLVSQAKSLTDNLSGVVESLLADFVSRTHHEKLQKTKAVEAAMSVWNQFNSDSGSIADEYSSL
jgi:antitoxin CcdA